MLTLITFGVFILLALSILCFAAYKIRAQSFEFSTTIWKIASFSIKIRSPEIDDRGAVLTGQMTDPPSEGHDL